MTRKTTTLTHDWSSYSDRGYHKVYVEMSLLADYYLCLLIRWLLKGYEFTFYVLASTLLCTR